jgi:hypothetical protein
MVGTQTSAEAEFFVRTTPAGSRKVPGLASEAGPREVAALQTPASLGLKGRERVVTGRVQKVHDQYGLVAPIAEIGQGVKRVELGGGAAPSSAGETTCSLPYGPTGELMPG